MYPQNFPTHLYLANARTKKYKDKLESATLRITEALSKAEKWYVAWSGGKDSTVLAHLVNRISPGIVIWSEKDDCDFPGELEYVKSVAQKYNFNLQLFIPLVSLWEQIEKLDIDICNDLHSRGTEFSDKFFYSAVSEQEKGFDGVFLGLRNQESNARRMNFLVRGHTYKKRNGKITCNPLHDWTGTDIFSYLVTNQIPILDVYFKTRFVDDPAKIRKSWMLPSGQAAEGHCVWLRYYYPELFNKLLQKFPHLRDYT